MLKTLADNAPSLADLLSPIHDEMQAVEQRLKQELSSRDRFVDKLLQKSHRLSGKRLRPALLLLIAKANGTLGSEHVLLATAIEMIHTATLVHDDILDGADQRRHSATMNSEFGNQIAILTGDFLFSQAFFLTSTLPTTIPSQEIGRTTKRVCEGELRQIGTQGNVELSEADYLEIIDAKTAALCSCAAKLGCYCPSVGSSGSKFNGRVVNGGVVSGNDSFSMRQAEFYGQRIGVAFQIVDDVLDILGNSAETGKSLGTDLAQVKPTLPLIHLLRSVDDSERTEICETLRKREANSNYICERMGAVGSFEYCMKKAEKFASDAIGSLSNLANSPSKKVLSALPEFILKRTH